MDHVSRSTRNYFGATPVALAVIARSSIACLLLVLGSTLVCSTGCSPNKTQASGPERTLTSFLKEAEAGRLEEAAKMVYGHNSNADLSYEKKYVQSSGYRIENFRVNIDGDSASAIFDMAADRGPTARNQRVELKKVGSDWLIVPTPGRARDDTQSFAELAHVVAFGPYELGKIFGPTAQASGDRLVYLARAARQYLATNGGVFSFDQKTMRDALSPYVSDSSVFYDDLEQKYPFQFNEKLKGKSLAEILHPDVVVMFYVGENGKLQYPFYGTNVLATVSGKVIFFLEGSESSYSWEIK